MKKSSFVFGAIILALSGVICKILGAVYKIPLTNILGSEGIGIYYLIFPIYAFLLSFISSSFVVAISKNISNLIAKKDDAKAHNLFKSCICLLLLLGIFASLLLVFLSKIIARLQGVENAFLCYVVIAPSLIAVSVSSAFKGYFQGLQNMVPTALSQVFSQIIKLAGGFSFAAIFAKQGVIYGALGALVGISISEIVGLLFFVIYYFIFKVKNKNLFLKIKQTAEKCNYFFYFKFIIKESIPLTLSSVILPMSMVIDSFLIVNILKSMGFDKGFATSLLGVNSGIVNTLVGLPTTICSGICMTVIPYITYALSNKNYEDVSKKISLSIKLSLFIAIPCAIVFALFSANILNILYAASFDSFYELKFASTLLVLSSINILYLNMLQLTTSILQALNRSYIPVISLAVALIFKILCEGVLISIPYLNIAGAIISNVVCYIISSAINVVYIKKQVELKMQFYKTIICPIVCSLGACGFIVCFRLIFDLFLSVNWSMLIALFLGAVIYFVLIFVFKGFSKEEKNIIFNLRRLKTKTTKKHV
ncbi:MAG: polysaccharide biosynthesis protein [Clostridia bacterium]|nr:polysaccharide biosynthesis protein [Clostridia bacterium]